MTWNSADFPDADYYSTSGNGIRIETAGLHSLLCRIFWASDPGAHAIMFNGVDPDVFAGYPGAVSAQSSFNLIGMVAMDARLAEGQVITVTVRHTAGANRNIDTDGSYMELRYLMSATTTGRNS